MRAKMAAVDSERTLTTRICLLSFGRHDMGRSSSFLEIGRAVDIEGEPEGLYVNFGWGISYAIDLWFFEREVARMRRRKS
jgi:hypothetical protein